MTREEARDKLIELKGMIKICLSTLYGQNAEISDCFDIAIEALSAEPCEDCISREQLVRELNAQMAVGAITKEVAIDMLEHLPPITPKSKSDVLDKIRAEIEENAYPIVHGVNNHEKGMTLYGILQVIDKYKAGSEE